MLTRLNEVGIQVRQRIYQGGLKIRASIWETFKDLRSRRPVAKQTDIFENRKDVSIMDKERILLQMDIF